MTSPVISTESSTKLDAMSLHESLLNHNSIIHLEGQVQLTKSGEQYLDSYLKVDYSLLSQAQKHPDIIHLKKSNPYFQIHHFPANYILPAQLDSHRDVFIYFPQPGQKTYRQKTFGIEFIDTSRQIYQKILSRCFERVFHPHETLNNLSHDSGFPVYLGAIFHEEAHKMGRWQMIPKPHPSLDLSSKMLASWGELAADTMIGRLAPSDPKPFLSHMLLKIFWYGRWNKITGEFTEDHDSWGGHVMLLSALKTGFFYRDGKQLHLNLNQWEFYLADLELILSMALNDQDKKTDDKFTQDAWNKYIQDLNPQILQQAKEIMNICEDIPFYP